MPLVEERLFETDAALVAELAPRIAEALAAGVAARGAASLAASGGATPGPLYDALTDTDIAWPDVWIVPADERWLAPDHADSNEGMLRRRLVTGRASAARFVSLLTDDADPHDAEAAVSARLTAAPTPFDIVVLGMGEDGHTASFFPGSPDLGRALEGPGAVAGVKAPGAAGSSLRMTLTLPALADARLIVLYIAGAAKLDVLRRAEAAPDAFPIGAVLKAAPVHLYWRP